MRILSAAGRAGCLLGSGVSHSNCESIILVDNGDDANIEELPEGVLGVDILRPLGNHVSLFDESPMYPHDIRLQCRFELEVSETLAVGDGRRDCPIGSSGGIDRQPPVPMIASQTLLGDDTPGHRTCMAGKCLGLLSLSIRRSPTPMAPEETMTTLCPSLRSFTAVSTMTVRTESRGSWVVSWTMELVPERGG